MAFNFRRLNPFRRDSLKPMTERHLRKVSARIPSMKLEEIEKELARLTNVSYSRVLTAEESELYNLLFKEKSRRQV